MQTSSFWPWDYDPEGEVYENLAWDLPGFRNTRKSHTAPERTPSGNRRRSGRPRRIL